MSGASAMRNAVKRVTHKERSQPSDRKKFGLLEKHKDYVERANDFKKKKNQLSLLKKKADARNPDEFYFGMQKAKVQNGTHKKLDIGGSLDTGTIALMKSQDAGYICMKKAIDDKKIERLKSNLHLIGEAKPSLHKIFVSTSDDVARFDAADHFQTDTKLVDRSYNRVRKSSTVLPFGEKCTEESVNRLSARKVTAYKELQRRSDRSNKLKGAIHKLSQQRSLSNKGARKKVVVKSRGEDVVLYKWKRERV
jgi:U3 small nucleolar RNA-associated protein 11